MGSNLFIDKKIKKLIPTNTNIKSAMEWEIIKKIGIEYTKIKLNFFNLSIVVKI